MHIPRLGGGVYVVQVVVNGTIPDLPEGILDTISWDSV